MSTDIRPWYREPLVWLVIAIPALAVVVGLSMLGYSIASYDGLVVDDYYKEGKAINQRLERQRRAAELGLEARLEFRPDLGQLSLVLDGNPGLAYPDRLRLSFHHSTRSNLDAITEPVRSGDRLYSSPLPQLVNGKWYVVLENEQWKMSRVLHWDGREQVLGISGAD